VHSLPVSGSRERMQCVPSSCDSTSVSQLAPVWVEGHLQMVPLASSGAAHTPPLAHHVPSLSPQGVTGVWHLLPCAHQRGAQTQAGAAKTVQEPWGPALAPLRKSKGGL